MKILIAEDDQVSRKFLYKFLLTYGECDMTVDGNEAVEAFKLALDENKPYDLVCLDIMMPNMDGYQALKIIRTLEQEKGIAVGHGVKIIMTTALNAPQGVYEAFDAGCEGYAAKPINTEKFIEVMQKLGLIVE